MVHWANGHAANAKGIEVGSTADEMGDEAIGCSVAAVAASGVAGGSSAAALR